MPGTGRTIGTIGGGALGTIAGPAGTLIGAGIGGMIGGMFDDDEDAMPRPSGRIAPDAPRYGGMGANAEAERASQIGAEEAARARGLGQQLGSDAQFGRTNAEIDSFNANRRAGGLYGDAAGMYGRAEGNAADAAAARGDAMASIGRLRSFYEQGPGPSAAQAQLKQGADSSMRQALSLARSGGGRDAMQGAIMSNAGTRAQTNQAAATLRAQEAADFQNRRLNAMGMEQGALQNVRSGDMGVMGQRFGAGGQMLGAAGQAAQTGLGYGGLGAQYQGLYQQGRLGAEGMAQGARAGGEQGRAGILGNQLGADTSRYGADRGVAVGMANVAQRDRAADMAMTGTLIGAGVNAMSDIRAKENIRPTSAANLVERVDALKAIGGEERGVPTSAFGVPTKNPRPDLRAAGSYAYDYKSPSFGPDNQVGPMAQELEQTDAAGAVTTGPDGMKSVDTGRLTMTNTAAIAEQQRRLAALEAIAAGTGKREAPAVSSRRPRGERF